MPYAAVLSEVFLTGWSMGADSPSVSTRSVLIVAVLLQTPFTASAWQHAAIGSFVYPGDVTIIDRTVLIARYTSRLGWGGNRDQCTFVYRTIEGDFDIAARVTDTPIYNSPRGGIMVRESLEDYSKAVFLKGWTSDVYSGGGRQAWYFGYRKASLGNITWQNGTDSTDRPYENWLRLRRSGDTFVVYVAHYGNKDWIEVFSHEVPMNHRVLVGFSTNYSGSELGASAYAMTFEDYVFSPEPPVRPQAPILAIDMYAGLTFEGTVGARHAIQATSDASQSGSWSKVSEVRLAESPFFWVDPNSSSTTKRFYRIVPID